MHRFFLNPVNISSEGVTFPGEIGHQISRVLRLDEGDHVAVLDNCGHIYEVQLVADDDGKIVRGKIILTSPVETEPDFQLALFFGLTSREKMEWIFQKGTEVGVSAFYPFVSSRTLSQSATLTEKKINRWERIICEAAEQSGRGTLPVLHPVKQLAECYSKACEDFSLRLIAWEQATGDRQTLKTVMNGFISGPIALFVGPEGGFSSEEIDQSLKAGFHVVSLGQRILRMETAAILFPALVLHELGSL